MPRPSFDEIYAAAVQRKGETELLTRLPHPRPPVELASLPDHRYLAAMAKAAFSAGFRWWIVDAMWEGFEAAFAGFDPQTVAGFDDDKIEELGEDTSIVRNKIKIWATIENARFICQVAEEHGAFASRIAGWPIAETVELWEFLADGGTHLGGNTGPRALRQVGRDTFILTRDVEYALQMHGLMTYGRNTKTGRRQAQDAFLGWREESGRPLSQISMILSCAYDTPPR